MNSELEKLIEKYRITVNGLADLESGYDQVIKERGFVTLNGLLVSGESAGAHSPSGEPTPVVPAPSEGDSSHNEPAAPVPPTPSEPATEQPGVTPVPSDPAVSGDTNLGTEVASGESAENAVNTETHSPSGEERSEENTDAEEESSDEPAAGGKPKKKKK